MTMTAEQYIAQVTAPMPRPALRTQVAMELRAHINERLAGGVSLDDVIKQLGDPSALADSYLSAEPLQSAGAWSRIGAKIVDAFVVILAILPLAFGLGSLAYAAGAGRGSVVIVLVVSLLGSSFAFCLYMIIAESFYAQTFGKRLFKLRVVQESGARISVGQAIVRQLPLFFQVAWLDAAFALFTERHQRAVEMLSKTRTIDASQEVM